MQYGYSKHILETSRELKPKQAIWSDEIQQKLEKCNLEFINRLNENELSTKNKTIMDYAVDYVKRVQRSGVIEAINHVRIYKKMILPCELVGFTGETETREFRNVLEESSVMWKVSFNIVLKPHKRIVEVWSQFLEWMKEQHIETIIDF